MLQGRRQKAGAGFVVQENDGLLGCHSKAKLGERIWTSKPSKAATQLRTATKAYPAAQVIWMTACRQKRRGSRKDAGRWFLNGSLKTA